MIYLVKQHKVTGEIVKIDVATTKIPLMDGRVHESIQAKVKAATEANTDYLVIGFEGNPAPMDLGTKKISIREAYGISDSITHKTLKMEGAL